jgi:hypothetical protein
MRIERGVTGSRFPRLLMLVLAAALLVSTPVRASLIVAVGSAVSISPSSNDTLEITLTNTGPTALSLGSFSFEVEVTDPHVTFTSATTGTGAAYVFDGNSTFGPTISTSAPGQTLAASDLWAGVGGALVGAGATVGLGHVVFDVSAGALPGPITVTLSPFPATSLSDSVGTPIAIDSLMNGSITISSVPEPSALTFTVLGLAALTWTRRQDHASRHPQLGKASEHPEVTPACVSCVAAVCSGLHHPARPRSISTIRR